MSSLSFVIQETNKIIKLCNKYLHLRWKTNYYEMSRGGNLELHITFTVVERKAWGSNLKLISYM